MVPGVGEGRGGAGAGPPCLALLAGSGSGFQDPEELRFLMVTGSPLHPRGHRAPHCTVSCHLSTVSPQHRSSPG